MLSLNYVGEYDSYEVEFDRNEHVVTLKGDFPIKTTGFYLSQLGKINDLDYTAFKTVYRVIAGGVQFSDDGSVWVEPTRDVTVQAVWDDHDDIEGLRPYEVIIKVNGKDVVLSAEAAWQRVYEDIKESEVIEVTGAADIAGYDKTINGTTVVYHHEYLDPTPSLEERVNDLEIAVCELADVIG